MNKKQKAIQYIKEDCGCEYYLHTYEEGDRSALYIGYCDKHHAEDIQE